MKTKLGAFRFEILIGNGIPPLIAIVTVTSTWIPQALVAPVVTAVICYMMITTVHHYTGLKAYSKSNLAAHIFLLLTCLMANFTGSILYPRIEYERNNGSTVPYSLVLFPLVSDWLRSQADDSNISVMDMNEMLGHLVASLEQVDVLNRDFRASLLLHDPNTSSLRGVSWNGTGYDRDISTLNLDVSPKADNELLEEFLSRIGAPGWTWLTGQAVLDFDILDVLENERHRPNNSPITAKYLPDRAMFTSLVMSNGQKVGVLTASSIESGHFNANQVEIVQFFESIIARFFNPQLIVKCQFEPS